MKPERDRDIFKVLHAIRGMSAADVARKAKSLRRAISPATIAKLRRPIEAGGTRFPQRYTLDTIARVGGLKYELVPLLAETTRRPRDDRPEIGALQ